MKTSFLCRALQASIIASLTISTLAQSTPSATSSLELSAMTTLGCYSNADPLNYDNTDTFQTPGLCQPACAKKGHSVMALTGGSTCYCGDIIPALDNKVDDGNCNSPCNGFDLATCGGIGFWQIFLTGLTGDVTRAPNATTNSTQSSGTSHGSTGSSSAATSHAAETVIVTQSATPPPLQVNNDRGPNKVGIAVGVVVGVIAIAAVAGGAILFYKQKKRREIEEEHKSQAAINSFVGSRASDPKADARLDPSVASSYRRESIGSIADERDFSRRILQVRNPDRGSINSVA